MDVSIKWIIDYDTDPGYASYSKTCASEEETKKEAEILEKKGFYIFNIRKQDQHFLLSLEDE